MKHQSEAGDGNVQRTTDMGMGMFAMMAMMMICCLGVFILIALIPVIGWPAGIAVAIAGGAALMYGHYRLMGHGSHH